MHRHVAVSQLWGQRQNLWVPPGREARVWACSPSRLITHSPHSPQLCSTGQLGSVPGAEGLQGWPGGGQALLGSSLQGPWGSFRLARQTLSKEECELSGHLGPFHLTHLQLPGNLLLFTVLPLPPPPRPRPKFLLTQPTATLPPRTQGAPANL